MFPGSTTWYRFRSSQCQFVKQWQTIRKDNREIFVDALFMAPMVATKFQVWTGHLVPELRLLSFYSLPPWRNWPWRHPVQHAGQGDRPAPAVGHSRHLDQYAAWAVREGPGEVADTLQDCPVCFKRYFVRVSVFAFELDGFLHFKPGKVCTSISNGQGINRMWISKKEFTSLPPKFTSCSPGTRYDFGH